MFCFIFIKFIRDKMPRLSKYRGVLFALVAALLFGASTPFSKILLSSLDPSFLAGLLYLGSGAGLGIWLLLKRLTKRRSLGAPLGKHDFPWLAGAILTGGALGPLLLMLGLKQLTGFAASLLLNMEAVFTIALAWFVFKEHFDRRIAIGAIAIVLGSIILSTGNHGGNFSFTGGLLVIGACLCWGIDNNLTRKISGGDPIQISFYKGLFGGLANILITVFATSSVTQLSHILSSGPGMLIESVFGFTSADLGINKNTIFYAGILGLSGYGISLVFFILALRHIGTARTGAYFSTAPFIGSLLSIFLLGDTISLTLVVAALFMAFGVWLHLSENHEHEHRHNEIEHEHFHTHDTHHQHEHTRGESTKSHSHRHKHTALVHAHHHYPDLHHRHSH